MDKKINYISRDFKSIKLDLINFCRKHYPNTFTEFNDNSIGTLLLELNAAVGDMLSYAIDRSANESTLDYAQSRRALLDIARTQGVKIPFKKPSISIGEFSVEVPTRGDTFDLTYAPLLLAGAQVLGGGQIFETETNINFASPFTEGGIPNRRITPNVNSSGQIISYTLTKSEMVIAGKTKYFKRTIGNSDVRPFLQISLPDDDILSVEKIVQLDGLNYNRLPTIVEQNTFENIWFAVDSLAENELFLQDNLDDSDNEAILVGRWTQIPNRFIYEYSNNGFVTITLGNSTPVEDVGEGYVSDSNLLLDMVKNYANSNSLGNIPRPNTTMFIQYRVGGGAKSNVGVGIINSMGTHTIIANGQSASINSRVQRSLTVTNPIPALGGTEGLDTEELRYLIKYNQASQKRCVTLTDYYARLKLMDSKFGVPYKLTASNIDNKVEISVVGVDSDNLLTNSSTSTLKENISNYLGKFKMINDYISVRDGRIINLSLEYDILAANNANRNAVANEIINKTVDFFTNKNLVMGQDIYLSELLSELRNISGILNIVNYRVFNEVGQNLYSTNEIGQNTLNNQTREIDVSGTNALFANYNEIFELKYPERDVRVRFTTLN